MRRTLVSEVLHLTYFVHPAARASSGKSRDNFRLGSWYRTSSGQLYALSLVNNTATDLSVPLWRYHPGTLPFSAEQGGYDADVAHFMALCMRSVYEKPEIIKALSTLLLSPTLY